MTINQLIFIKGLIDSNFFAEARTALPTKKVSPTFEKHLRALERELGGPLFERCGRRIVGTTALCDQLAPQFKLLLDTTDNIKAIGEEHDKGDRDE